MEKGMFSKRERKIVIIGNSGAGKSCLGNNLLGKNVFNFRGGFSSVTTSSELGTTGEENDIIKVVDTPGLFAPKKGHNIAKQALDILESLNICENPQAFLIVLRYDCRYTEQELSAVRVLEITFGPEFLRHAIVVFTHVENEIDDDDIENEWRKSEELTRLIESCGYRVARIDNKRAQRGHIDTIMLHVDKLSMDKSEGYSYMYQHCHKKVLAEMAKLDEYDGRSANEQVKYLAEDIKREIKTSEETKKLEKKEEDLKDRERAIEKREEECNNMLDKIIAMKRDAKEKKNRRNQKNTRSTECRKKGGEGKNKCRRERKKSDRGRKERGDERNKSK